MTSLATTRLARAQGYCPQPHCRAHNLPSQRWNAPPKGGYQLFLQSRKPSCLLPHQVCIPQVYTCGQQWPLSSIDVGVLWDKFCTATLGSVWSIRWQCIGYRLLLSMLPSTIAFLGISISMHQQTTYMYNWQLYVLMCANVTAWYTTPLGVPIVWPRTKVWCRPGRHCHCLYAHFHHSTVLYAYYFMY